MKELKKNNEGRLEGVKEIALRLFEMGAPLEKIIKVVGVDIAAVKEWLSESVPEL